MRSLLENALGLTAPAELVYLSKRRGQEVRIHQSDRPDDEICLLFGRNPGRMERVAGEALDTRAATPARLAIYDAPLDPESITAQMRENLDDEITEVKSENAIDRITSQANPRTLERVPAGARFHVRMVLDVLCEEDKALAARLIEGLRLLEDDALGGGGSRGSGRVRFANLKLIWRNRAVLFVRRRGSRTGVGRGSGQRCRRWSTTLPSAKNWRVRCMARGLLIRLRPTGPWRIGPDSGDRDRVDRIYHSDSLYSAVSRAMARLGMLDEWLDATARRRARPCASVLLPVSRRYLLVVPAAQLVAASAVV